MRNSSRPSPWFECQVHDFATHEKEIDDIDFSPDSARLLSVSKDKVSLGAVVLLAIGMHTQFLD